MAKIRVDLAYPLFTVERKIFGHFTEHAFGNIYGGMYDPGSSKADEDGFRTDVLELMRRVKVPLLRYPGGNFVSNYHWEDGVGPKEQRPRVFEYAWMTEESNQFGTAEFIALCRKVGAEPLICVNMGSGTVEEAMHWVEYCNGTGNTKHANLRRSHGYEEPFNVKYWGLGNEMYGNWQFENLSAEQYAARAFQYAKAIKWIDPTVKLIACGFEQSADWNYTCMKAIGPMCDYISAHHYSVVWGPFEKDNYLQNLYIPDYIEDLHQLTLAAIRTGMNDIPRHCKVAWNEWNLFGWCFPGVNDDATYTLHNAIIAALTLNRLLRNSDTVGMANYSTFVNINGAVSVHGDQVLCRAQYPVFELLANNLGDEVLDVKLACPTLTVPVSRSDALGRPPLGTHLIDHAAAPRKMADIPVLDCLATRSHDGTLYLCVVNKSPDEDVDTEISLSDLDLTSRSVAMQTIWHEDLTAANTLENPGNVAIKDAVPPAVIPGGLKACFRKHSVNLITLR